MQSMKVLFLANVNSLSL